ncbi:MBOAT family O-acyltransferase [Pedobacter metabolipauper]|uniref:Alginate O-acetyltransferase complex protein AlgI n=1 Tax=Pedobacter metabolipauper TaxID=425513 RepID=A0A4V3D1B3_9SPHI|nr:MBOAT family O-acyltransferase [Pedobacter metabolipauper]TDQ10007.1 alginate O-acetyltransferase complex protein AlgI [Pedobacter metabolipauper]
MLFNSYIFIILLFVTFVTYYIPRLRKFQIPILIISSFIFYSWYKPILLILFVTSILLNTSASFYVLKSNIIKKRKLVAGIAIAANLLILAFFKYTPLVSEAIYNELNLTNSWRDFFFTIPLPIGISFYTFEGISLLVDVLRNNNSIKEKNVSFTKHLINTSFFISFFPHLIAGPILKAHDFYPQMKEKWFADIDWQKVVKCLIIGYFLKMVVADNLNELTAPITYPFFLGYSSANLLLLLFGYSMQIFADFAGYSSIAIGLGYLFGYRLPLNFNFPYISKSFSEFWTRWHISLSTWLKEYLYFPLGGNRKGQVRTYFNLFIVMVLGGFWHGSGWSYALWGIGHGTVLAIERLFKDKIKIKETLITQILSTALVFVVVTLLWLLFKLPNFTQVIEFLGAIVDNRSMRFSITSKEVNLVLLSAFVIFYHAYYLLTRANKISRTVNNNIQVAAYGILLFLILVNSGNQSAFIYFQF